MSVGSSSHDLVVSSTSPEPGGAHGLPGVEIVDCGLSCEVVCFSGGLIPGLVGQERGLRRPAHEALGMRMIGGEQRVMSGGAHLASQAIVHRRGRQQANP